MAEIIVHPNPAWRDRANFIIRGRINSADSGSGPSIEQLWACQIDEFQFEICCIPFFLYNLTLGDVVTTGTFGESNRLKEESKLARILPITIDITPWPPWPMQSVPPKSAQHNLIGKPGPVGEDRLQ